MSQMHTACLHLFLPTLLERYSLTGAKKKHVNIAHWQKSLHTSQVPHKAGAYLGFYNIEQLRILLLPPRWDASPS